MGWLGDAWDAVTGAAGDAWVWLTGDGEWGWLRAIFIIISLGAALAGLVFIIIGATLLFEIAIVVLGIAALFLFIYSIATRKK